MAKHLTQPVYHCSGCLLACVSRVSLKLKIREDRAGSLDIVGESKKGYSVCANLSSSSSDLSIGALENVTADLQGMGILNWLLKKVVQGEVEEKVTNTIITSGREMLSREFSQLSLIDEMHTSLLKLIPHDNITFD